MFSGEQISIGRNTQRVDWVVRFLGRLKNRQDSLRAISRHHCDISIGKPFPTIIDCSTTGTSLNDILIPKGKEIVLADDDIISLAGVFRFRVRVTNDESGVVAVILTRYDDGVDQHCYALLRRGLDLKETGAQISGMVLREGKTIYVSVKPDSVSQLDHLPLTPGKLFEWHCGSHISSAGESLVMESPVTCPHCGQHGAPKPDTNTCSHCATPLNIVLLCQNSLGR